MRTNRVIGTTVMLLLVGGMMAGSAQAQGHSQDQSDRQQGGKAKGHDRQQAKQQQHQQQVATQQEQQSRINEQRQRDSQYRVALVRQVRAAQEHSTRLEQQNRRAQLAAQQQYLVNLRQQQQRLQAERDYTRDPALSARSAYRYRRTGVVYQTTRYGAEVLRQAVAYGYQQGYQAGRADRRDGSPSSYQSTYAYQDANYGYDARYVSQYDYNYYFREGLRRGYQDGYGTRPQYGTVTNGSPSILSSILTSVLGLVAIR